MNDVRVSGDRYETEGYALAMRVMQSALYCALDERERAECDEFIRRGQALAPEKAEQVGRDAQFDDIGFTYMIVFSDPDRGVMHFTDYEEARQRYEDAKPRWTCRFFAATDPATHPEAQAVAWQFRRPGYPRWETCDKKPEFKTDPWEVRPLFLHPATDEAVRLRAALTRIRDEEGDVCDSFESCAHRACQSSYGAWSIADEALK